MPLLKKLLAQQPPCARTHRCATTTSATTGVPTIPIARHDEKGIIRPNQLGRQPRWSRVSQPSEKFLLTGATMAHGRGTDHDEPEAAGLAAMAAPGQEKTNYSSEGGPTHGSQRALGAETAAADEAGERSGGGARIAGATVEPTSAGGEPGTSGGD